MPQEDTNELGKLFDVLYRIDQRLLCEAELLENNQEVYETGGNKNTRREDE